MEYYRNLSGVSRVHAYEIGQDSITIQLDTEVTMHYTYSTMGMGTVEEMKRLAAKGSGLNRFIKAHLKNRYELLVTEASRPMRLQG